MVADPPRSPAPRKPMARAARVSLFEREVRERLSGAALEILLERARLISEGRRSDRPAGAFFGSTMLTIDVRQAGEAVRESCDAAAAVRVGQLLAADGRLVRRVQAIAAREAVRLCGAPVRLSPSEVRVRTQGTLIFIDVELEGAVEQQAARR
jgi:hypothetical protein